MNFVKKIFFFYYDGLKNMTNFGKSLWKLVVLKAIILVIIANFLFPNILEKYFNNDAERSDFVGNNILNHK